MNAMSELHSTNPSVDEDLVSVIVPTHNRAESLGESIESLLGQTHREIEVIVVNDASTDRTPEVCQVCSERDSRVHTVHLAESVGPARARNVGFRQAQGGWVAFNDDDTTWREDRLERLLAAARTCGDNLAFTYGPLRYEGIDGSWELRQQHRRPEAPGDRAWGVGTPRLMFPRTVFEALGGFDDDLPRLQDFDLCLRALRHGDACYAPDAWCYVSDDGEGVSGSDRRLRCAIELLQNKYRRSGLLASLPDYDRWRLRQRFGEMLMVADCPSEARRCFRRALAVNPRSLRTWRALLASRLGSRAFQALGRLRRTFTPMR